MGIPPIPCFQEQITYGQKWRLSRVDAERERRTKAQRTADWILKRANPAESHAYLETKGITAVGDLYIQRKA
jgi:hypothetical protein